MLALNIVLLFLVLSSAAGHSLFYRRDYTYIEEYEAFYKLHYNVDVVNWETAFMACDDEGARLFYPKNPDEFVVLKNLTASLAKTLNTTDVLVGIHDETGQGEFVTVEGAVYQHPVINSVEKSMPLDKHCVIVNIENATIRKESCNPDPQTSRLFVCKKVDERPCKTIDLAYEYSKETKKCYKVNHRERTWQEAWHTCYMEGAMLVSPDSNGEAEVLKNKITDGQFYFTGFRRIYPGSDFYTVKGQKLEESGFQDWGEERDDDIYSCGGVYYSSNYQKLFMKNEECHIHHPFICEMAAKV